MILEILKWAITGFAFLIALLVAFDLALKWRLDYLKRKEREREYQKFKLWAHRELFKAYTGVELRKLEKPLEIYHFEKN